MSQESSLQKLWQIPLNPLAVKRLMTMVFNIKFEVEKFNRMNRQFKVIHIMIQELDTVLDDKLEDKDNGVNTRSIQFGLLRAKLVFQL